ncbi:site-specific integrase [Kitasatospora sp. RB6PN24]|uniref:tyrosine-type recombinase/integrase n=1 Tax=Kitasatospora humi TaxID=2893891 RepID=UPI001E2EAF47|nr:site-specific integrase [Kitasatospora humi]MCC9312065.1 site-specific integrase [Kitasatospora humi]
MPGSKVGTSARVKGPTTGRVRRHSVEVYERDFAFTPTAVQPAPPPPPAHPPRPLGELSTAPTQEIAELTGTAFGSLTRSSSRPVEGMRKLLEILEQFPGSTWQDRWEASGLNERGRLAKDLYPGTSKAIMSAVNTAAGHAFAMRVIQPSLLAFRSYRFSDYVGWFRQLAQDPVLEEFFERTLKLPMSGASIRRAQFDMCIALTVFGIDIADLTPEALLHYAMESRKYGVTPGEVAADGCFAATQAWVVLSEMGHFPASTPRTLRGAVTRGQRTVAELVDKHQLRNQGVRDLLVDYIGRRSVELDYSSLTGLVNNLVRLFWKVIEEFNPDQADLRLTAEAVAHWKEKLLVNRDGTPRLHLDAPFMVVRAFYLDLHTWAVAEPERWAQWVAPCPIRDEDLRWFHVRRRRLQERMANRTRERQPLVPILSQHVTDQWHRWRTLLEAARAVDLGERFTVDGVEWQRVSAKSDVKRPDPSTAAIRAVNRSTGELVQLTHTENQAFWQWAIVETLRLAGLRAEELTELTHLSVRNYQRPNGEVVALLVITPSKSDRERVIPMSAELFHVIAQVIRRHIRAHGTLPVCTRYDLHEKVWSDPLPYLFQTVHSGAVKAMSNTTMWRMIHRAADGLVSTDPRFAEVKFASHDFRRLFATELVNNGLPIHIGAALLGHLNIQTTRGYVAVFDDDVVRHYQEFLARRRAQRPESEYRKPTETEWSEFNEHFDKRRVELGSCGRPYGAPCTHEHACIRCPMLSINPKMLPRLDELEEDLLARRERAVGEGRRGEIDGLDLTLTFLRSKREQAQRFQRTGPVPLGLPVIPHQKPQVTGG